MTAANIPNIVILFLLFRSVGHRKCLLPLTTMKALSVPSYRLVSAGKAVCSAANIILYELYMYDVEQTPSLPATKFMVVVPYCAVVPAIRKVEGKCLSRR